LAPAIGDDDGIPRSVRRLGTGDEYLEMAERERINVGELTLRVWIQKSEEWDWDYRNNAEVRHMQLFQFRQRIAVVEGQDIVLWL